MAGTTLPHYKLYYFGIRGRAEPIRYIFAAAEVPYEDEMIPYPMWEQLKPSMKPFNTMPVLEIDHKERLGQSGAICRYLAKRFGLAGKDSLEQAKADMYVDGVGDVYQPLAGSLGNFLGELMSGKTPVEWLKVVNAWCDEKLIPWLTLYTEFLEANPTHSGWFVGDRVTYADLFIAEFLTKVQMWNPDAIKNHPKIQNLIDRVHSIPGIQKRAQNRASGFSKAWGGNAAPPM